MLYTIRHYLTHTTVFNDIPVNKSYFSVDEQTLNSSWMLFVDVNFKTGSRKHIALTQIRCVA